MKRISAFLYQLIEPRSQTDDLQRREFVFNIILSALIVLLIFANIVTVSESILLGSTYRGLSPLITIIVLSLFLFFFHLSRRGYFYLASYFLIGIIFSLAAYMSFKWGVDLVASLLFYALAIVMAGILLNKRHIFITSFAVGCMLVTVGYFQAANKISPNRYWTSEMWGIAETSVAVIIFMVIATITWLYNREIEKSILKLRKSEAELKEERDTLEIKVEQRSKELKEAQAEKMAQLYRFAEFGRISSGLFHDLINPLNAVSLNLGKTDGTAEETKQYVGNAVRAAKKLEDLVVAVRKQLAREETKALFLVEEEIRHVIEVLSHKAQNANVELRFTPRSDIQMFGDAIKFNQVVLNLVANGIDACMPSTTELVPVSPGDRWVQVSLIEEPETMIMLVEDNGVGIPEHHMDKIFEPFFTTKTNGRGIGIGLSMARRIVEKDFGGLLVAKSEAGRGSSFKASLPMRKQTEYAT
jgi:signal transduction histidine kinase